MDFARRQLEKYGWTDGKGLGKNENGIAQALKPKLKRSVTGIGHDAAADFTEHWWTALYDKAAGNVEVEEKHGKTKKIKTKDNTGFEITNSTWRLKRKQNDSNNEEYADYFVKKAVLAKGGARMENFKDSESEDEETEKKDVFKMTDEELFAACEGRTAHKGARFGLKATGKLARIQKQEQMLLTQSRFEGYSHAKACKANTSVTDLQVVEDMNLNSDNEKQDKRKKKKKKKHCIDTEGFDIDVSPVAELTDTLPWENKSQKVDSVASEEQIDTFGRQQEEANDSEEMTKQKRKKKRKAKYDNFVEASVNLIDNDVNQIQECAEVDGPKKSKKKKKKMENKD